MDDWRLIVYGDLFSVHRALFLPLSLLCKWMIRVTSVQSEWVMSHVWSCCTYEWVLSLIWTSHVTHMNESCHTYEYFISTLNAIFNGPQCALWWMKESCNTHEWVMSHIWISHVTHVNISCSHQCYNEAASKRPMKNERALNPKPLNPKP